jgi:hypothetical protein
VYCSPDDTDAGGDGALATRSVGGSEDPGWDWGWVCMILCKDEKIASGPHGKSAVLAQQTSWTGQSVEGSTPDLIS